MKWGLALNVRDSISKTVEKATIADRGGIDQIWVTDFPAIRHAPAVAAAIAENTESCRIGVGLISPLLYSPFHIVQFMITLVQSHGERFDLLLGPGDRFALERIGISNTIKEIVEKTVKSMSEIKSELSDSGLSCRVLLGAQGPKMIERSLDADGVLLNYTDLKMAAWAANLVEGRTKADFDFGLFPPAFIGPCERFIDNQAISHSAAMVALGLGKTVSEKFDLHSSINSARKLLRERGEIDAEVVETLGEDVLKRFAFCGTPKELQTYIVSLEEIGYTSVVFGPPVGLSRKGVESLLKAKELS